MEEKIFEKLKKDELKVSYEYGTKLGLLKRKDKLIKSIPKKNIDLKMLLSKLELIEDTPENDEIINEYHDHLFKYGISEGIKNGKIQVIKGIKKHPKCFDEVMKYDLDKNNEIKIVPSFVKDLMEAIK